MKIGLLTVWKSLNYGANLQALALFHYLRKHNYDVSLIDYGQPADCKGPMVGPMWYLGFYNHLSRRFYKRWIMGFIRLTFETHVMGALARFSKTRAMLGKLFGTKVVRYNDYDTFAGDSRFPVAMIGSDQVWAPMTMNFLGEGYLLDRLPHEVKRLSYAAGISCEDLVCEATGVDWTDKFDHALRKFAAISIRERKLIPTLESLIDRKIYWATDPTLLFDAEQWSALLNLRAECDVREHITIYWISDIRPYADKIITFAEAQKCEVHLFNEFDTLRIPVNQNPRQIVAYIQMMKRFRKCKNLRICRSANAREFVQDVSTASGVVSDSYHALMFSTIYKRNAKIVIPPARYRMGSRMRDFLGRLGWGNAIVNDISPQMLDEISNISTGSRETLNCWIEESKQWLDNALRQLEEGSYGK